MLRCYIMYVRSHFLSNVILAVCVIIFSAHLCLGRRLHSRNLLVQRQDIRHRAQRRDSEWVDLAVTLGVVLLDVSELGRASESLVVPVEVAQPPERRRSVLGSRRRRL